MKTPVEYIREEYGENWVFKTDWATGDVCDIMAEFAKYYHEQKNKELEFASSMRPYLFSCKCGWKGKQMDLIFVFDKKNKHIIDQYECPKCREVIVNNLEK